MKKRLVLMGVLLLFLAFCGCQGLTEAETPEAYGAGATREYEYSAIRFDFAPGTYYACFTDSTSEECRRFEAILEEAGREAGWEVIFFDAAGSQDKRLSQLLRRYQIETYPTVIRIFDTKLRDSYGWDARLNKEETLQELEGFLLERGSSLVSVREQREPVQFDSYFHAFTFAAMLAIFVWLFRERKQPMTREREGQLLFLMAFATLLAALHLSIAYLGMGFSFQAEAEPAHHLGAWIGTGTWLTVTPVLYLLIIGLGAKGLSKEISGA